jgi:membrane-bound ClpP family serine protease
MELVSVIILVGCGILAASPLIIQKKPEAKELIEKMTPYQGIGGVILLIWGFISLIRLLVNICRYQVFSIMLLTFLILCLVSIALGFLMGYALISKYVLSKNEQAVAKGELVRAKLTKIQVPLGIAGIILGLWGLVSWIIYL